MDFVEQLKSSVDIVKVIREYVPSLKKAGSGSRYMGLCPFHNEKTPSFSVHGTHQFYKCFGCDAKGDMINFVMAIEGLTFQEALKLIAERNGIAMPKRQGYSDAESRVRGSVLDMHELAGRLFRSALQSPAGSQARAYLERRGVSAATAEEFGLGYAEGGGNNLFKRVEKEGFAADLIEQSGLVRRRESDGGFYDYFRNRLIFPIHSESGKIIAFAGRALTDADEPKYLNSPETPIYRKSYVIYNLHRAKETIRKQDFTVLVEGYMDVIGVYAAGVRNVVASCGTALTATQVSAIHRHSQRIVVNFDPDAAGMRAAERSIEMLLDQSMHVRILELEGGLDPDEYVKANGAEVYRERLEKASGYFFWLADRARARFDLRAAEGRLSAFQFLLPKIHRISDKIERVAIANDVAGYLGVEPGLVLDSFRKAAAERAQKTIARPVIEIPPMEKLLLASLLASPEAQHQVIPRLNGLGQIQHFQTARIFQLVISLYSPGNPVRFSDLEARLEGAERELMTSLVFADDMVEATSALDQAVACLHTLESAGRKLSLLELKTRVKAAEQAGNMAEALRLTEELSRMERRQKSAGQSFGSVDEVE
jgi:DNA primase